MENEIRIYNGQKQVKKEKYGDHVVHMKVVQIGLKKNYAIYMMKKSLEKLIHLVIQLNGKKN